MSASKNRQRVSKRVTVKELRTSYQRKLRQKNSREIEEAGAFVARYLNGDFGEGVRWPLGLTVFNPGIGCAELQRFLASRGEGDRMRRCDICRRFFFPKSRKKATCSVACKQAKYLALKKIDSRIASLNERLQNRIAEEKILLPTRANRQRRAELHSLIKSQKLRIKQAESERARILGQKQENHAAR